MENIDPKLVSFSQAQGYESLPEPLKPEELSHAARVAIWNDLYSDAIDDVKSYGSRRTRWGRLLESVHSDHFGGALHEWRGPESTLQRANEVIGKYPFNVVFDLLTFIMRDIHSTQRFKSKITATFYRFQLAYVVDTSNPPTIYPISTPEEGSALVNALQQLDSAGLPGAREHLQQASTCINQQDWAGAVRESIHAVESVARQIAPGTKTLGDALKALEKSGHLEHGALKEGFSSIYGYTNNEQGIRHALLDQTTAAVGQDEALFMFGACASFASYMSRKHLAQNAV